MTVRPDVPIDDLRRAIVEGLQRAVDGLQGAYAAPLRRQLRAEGDVYDPAVLCLALGRLGGEETRTLPCALTLGLLEEMGRVFLGLEDGSTVAGAWGLPRTLNAADGLYALGRQILLTDDALDVETRVAAQAVYTQAARALAEALHAAAPGGADALRRATRSLYPAAASFAALCCGLDAARRDEVIRLAAEAADDVSAGLESVIVKASAPLLRQA